MHMLLKNRESKINQELLIRSKDDNDLLLEKDSEKRKLFLSIQGFSSSGRFSSRKSDSKKLLISDRAINMCQDIQRMDLNFESDKIFRKNALEILRGFLDIKNFKN